MAATEAASQHMATPPMEATETHSLGTGTHYTEVTVRATRHTGILYMEAMAALSAAMEITATEIDC